MIVSSNSRTRVLKKQILGFIYTYVFDNHLTHALRNIICNIICNLKLDGTTKKRNGIFDMIKSMKIGY